MNVFAAIPTKHLVVYHWWVSCRVFAHRCTRCCCSHLTVLVAFCTVDNFQSSIVSILVIILSMQPLNRMADFALGCRHQQVILLTHHQLKTKHKNELKTISLAIFVWSDMNGSSNALNFLCVFFVWTIFHFFFHIHLKVIWRISPFLHCWIVKIPYDSIWFNWNCSENEQFPSTLVLWFAYFKFDLYILLAFWHFNLSSYRKMAQFHSDIKSNSIY